MAVEADDDRALVARCRKGDERAWRELVTKYQKMVLAVARRVAGPAAEDAAQEAFLRMFKSIKRFREQAKFSTWLYRVVYNAACDVAAKRGVVASMPEGFEGRYRGPGPEEYAVAADYSRLTREALAAVRPEYRQVLELYYLMGNSYEEVASVTGFPLGTVKTFIRRGKQAMVGALRRAGAAERVDQGVRLS